MESKVKNKVKVITIIGREWFDKVNGNSYFSATAYIDNKEGFEVPFQYGYGDQYIWETFDALDKAGLLPDPMQRYKNGGTEAGWSYCQRLGIKLNCEKFSVLKKEAKRK